MKGKTKSTFLPQYQWYDDRHVISELLNLRVSFYWRHLADDKLLKTFRDWSVSPYKNTPDYIIMGQSEVSNNKFIRTYANILIKLHV